METPDWKFSQSFGEGRAVEQDAADSDLVSAIQFDKTGDYIAIGDKGGRIVIVEREDKPKKGNDDKKKKKGEKKNLDYRFLCEFQSHEPEFGKFIIIYSLFSFCVAIVHAVFFWSVVLRLLIHLQL